MKIARLNLPITIILVLVILSIFTVNSNAGRAKIVDILEENAIREVVKNYFNQRYSSRAMNHIGDFSEFTDGSLQAESFLKTETDKLEIEIHNAKVHYLGVLPNMNLP